MPFHISSASGPFGRLSRRSSGKRVIQALAEYLKNYRNIGELLNFIQEAFFYVAEPHLNDLGKAYYRVYRKPTKRNCGTLLSVERRMPMIVRPETYYTRSRDDLVSSFQALENHPVFGNEGLRRDLLALKTRTLTLFFTPHLIRPRSSDRTKNLVALNDALDQLSKLDRIEFGAALYFLRSSLDGDTGYNPNLVTNLSFLAYKRMEKVRLNGGDVRAEHENMNAMVNRARKQPVGSRRLLTNRMVGEWEELCDVPDALGCWAEMVGGSASYDRAALSRAFR